MHQLADRKVIQRHITAQFGLPEDQVAGLLDQFFQAIADHQSDFEQAVLGGDMNVIAKAAHKYKGALSNLGIKDGAELALAAEHAAKGELGALSLQETATSLKEIVAPLFQ